jgi:hypothetical protein
MSIFFSLKLFSVCIGNAGNYSKCAHCLGVHISSFCGSQAHLQCLAHIINLMAKAWFVYIQLSTALPCSPHPLTWWQNHWTWLYPPHSYCPLPKLPTQVTHLPYNPVLHGSILDLVFLLIYWGYTADFTIGDKTYLITSCCFLMSP